MSNQIKPQTLKGFRDFLPKDLIKRQYIIDKIKSIFERFGFDPLETPALEYADILLGKYGEDADRLMYIFEDRGGRKVGLRYDQTVPLARVIGQYSEKIVKPFKRYQIQPVWRSENPQKGRYREFLQCDADVIGGDFEPTADAEILTLFWTIYNELGFKSFQIVVNSRILILDIVNRTIEKSFGNSKKEKLQNYLFLTITRSLDKYSKIGEEGVIKELTDKGFPKPNIDNLIKAIKSIRLKSYRDLEDIDRNLYYSLQMTIENFKVPEEAIIIDPFMVRGLDYYTGIIFEGRDKNYSESLGGGGRYDELIGKFTGNRVPAVGFAIGFDRTVETAESLNLIPPKSTNTVVLIAIVENWKDAFPTALNLVAKLRSLLINSELFLNPRSTLDKQLKYADKKGIPYAIIIGPEEVKKNIVKLKNMKTGEQKEMKINDLIQELKSP